MSVKDIFHDLKFYYKMKKSALIYTLALFLGVKTSFAQNQAAAAPQTPAEKARAEIERRRRGQQ